ncbi:MAG TPA: ribosome maturation factor RimP [Thermotogales bacterium]|nr:ribosome maturation factor RimP [Thermotogales bacterium]
MSFMEEEVVKKVREIAEEIVRRYDLELFDVRYRRGRRGWTLTIYIDKLNGYVSIDDCERVSRDMDPILDSLDLIPHSYTLEVSSPGLDRPLRGPEDYKRFKGKLGKFILKEKMEGRKVLIGYIEDYESDRKILRIRDRDTSRSFEINVNNITKANLEVEF